MQARMLKGASTKMKMTKTKTALLIVSVIFIAIIGFILSMYLQGGKGEYTPPQQSSLNPLEQATADLEGLGRALEAYHGMNLQFPDSLKSLVPDLISKLPADPSSGKPYSYETDGVARYRVFVQNPNLYNLKTLAFENGKLFKE